MRLTTSSSLSRLSVSPLGLQFTSTTVVCTKGFSEGPGFCAFNLVKWEQAIDPSFCSCGSVQTMAHIIVDICPQTRFNGEMLALHLAGDNDCNELYALEEEPNLQRF